MNDADKISKLRKQADALTPKIAYGRRDATQNPTPKRQREERQRRTDADVMERQQRALRALADAIEAGTLPPILENVITRTEVAPLVARKMGCNGGYYDAQYETGEYNSTTPQAKALQAMLEPQTIEQRAAAYAKAQADKIRDLEMKLQFSPIPGFFPTPDSLINRMLWFANIHPGDKVLEPSAGKGDIADAIRALGVAPDVVECHYSLRQILEAKGHRLVGDDALSQTGKYDKIVMNPPFENGQDIDHVRHAFDQLNPGGKLVAIMSEGPFYRNDKKAAAFREWMRDVGALTEKNDPGAFMGKEAFRQTGVSTRIVEIGKPAAVVEVRGPAGPSNREPEFTPTPTMPKAGQGSLLGERYEGSGIGSHTGLMFGDMRPDPPTPPADTDTDTIDFFALRMKK
jgi:hypothetical protein